MQGSENEGKRSDEHRILLLNEEDAKEAPSHAWQKVVTLENWDGGVNHLDSADHLVTLDEIGLWDLVRRGAWRQTAAPSPTRCA
ncbi:MAG: hypothetical protein ACJAYU_005331 [Bradymonadia bacterium]